MNSRQPVGLKEGIYAGLPFKQYAADPAFNASGCAELVYRGPYSFWKQSPYNPKRITDQSKEMVFGQKMHKYLLEEETFFDEYFVMPQPTWHDGLIMVPAREYEQLKVMKNELLFDSKGNPTLVNGLLRRGMPECSIVVRDPETGIMIKTRHDYLHPEYTPDYKTIYSIDDGTIGLHIGKYGYDIQYVLYTKARQWIREKLHAGEAHFYGAFTEDFMKRFMESESDEFLFIFQSTEPPFEWVIKDLDLEVFELGEGKLMQGMEMFSRYMEQYGPDDEWRDTDQRVRSISLYEIPYRYRG